MQSGALAPEHVTAMVASGAPIRGSMLTGMAAKLSGTQVMTGAGSVMAPSSSMADALSAKRLSGRAPTMGATAGAVGHMSNGEPALVQSREGERFGNARVRSAAGARRHKCNVGALQAPADQLKGVG